jgi:undecaprenyl-diphosphatase
MASPSTPSRRSLRATFRAAAATLEPRLLALLAVAAGGAFTFAEIADEVGERETEGFDRRLLLALRTPGHPADPIGPRWAEELGRDFTAIGGIGLLVMVTLAAAGYLAMRRAYRALALLVVSTAGGWIASYSLKAAFARPRPQLVPHGSIVYSASFPSGHSMMSAVTYLTLAAILGQVQGDRRVRFYLVVWAGLLSMLTGASRVYLGVHWPTDVLAGWAGGATWAVLCWTVAEWLQRRGQLETDTGAPPPGDGDHSPPAARGTSFQIGPSSDTT